MDPNTSIKKYKNVGKAEKQAEQWRRRYEQDVIKMEPTTELEVSIRDTNLAITESIRTDRLVSLDSAFNYYINLRQWRHEVWVEFLDRAKLNVMYEFGDRRLRDFVRDLRMQEDIRLPDPPDAIARKTPDIAVYSREQRTIFIGDVAVARTVDIRDRSKLDKYAPIVRWLKSQGLRVMQVNLIIDETLSNVDQEISKLEKLDLIMPTRMGLAKTIEYHRICHNDMQRVMNRVDFPSRLVKRINDYDQIENPDKIDLPKIERPMPVVHTAIDEETIIGWVKEETDKRVNEKYYDENVEEAVKEFDAILNKQDPNKVVKPPKSTLLACSNSYSNEAKTSHDLIMDYVQDIGCDIIDDVKQYTLDLLPDRDQLKKMKEVFKTNRKSKDIEKKVFGPFQYSRTSKTNNRLTMDLNMKLLMGKKIRNEKKETTTMDTQSYNTYVSFVNDNIEKFGEKSNKAPFLSDEWASSNNFELENTRESKNAYDYCRTTVGAQLAHSFGNLYQRITHLKTSESCRDNIYVPPNGSFIVAMPKEHAPITSSTCDMPAIFIARYAKGDDEKSTCEYEHKFETRNYVYYVSKMCRFNVDKISNWDQAGYSLVATATYLLTNNKELMTCKEKVVGILTYLILDIHQKTSEYLDLLKYISFMPFSQVHRLSKLVKDKMDLLRKTKLDIWMITNMRNFIVELAKVDKIEAKKPIISLSGGKITRESLGIKMKLPSFINLEVRHSNVQQFIEEINTLFISRPKQLYGSQFMDKSITNTAEWNLEYENEIIEHGDWVTVGQPDECHEKYPFDAKFAFCRDAIIHAQNHFHDKVPVDVIKVEKNLSKENYMSYMHNSCTLRGCTKDKSRRKNKNDLHTTSMEECLYKYEKDEYKEEKATVIAVGNDFLNEMMPMEFSMSEKNQRGAGRPIATPTLGAKAALALIEKPESALGKCVPNNIIVSGKNKLKEMSEAYKDLVSDAAISGYKKVYQITEDQSKFSENDNIRKYYPYIENNHLLPPDVRKLQIKALDGMANREHLVKRMPMKILESQDLRKYINQDQNGIVANIGWPQGMLNFISTSVHSIADYWITHAYNIAYPLNKVITKGLVHSDDSWVVVACNTEEDFVRFSVFRAVAKKLFCLKLNDKKLWGSKYLGELVSNYNINGNVHLSVTKAVTNSFNSLMYQNWVIDVNSQVSSLQQAYRNGATLDTLIMMYTILSQQMMQSYQVKGKHYQLIYLLPIELGGYPDKPVFSIAVTGLHSHYQQLLNVYTNREVVNEDYMKIVTKAMTLSALQNQGIKIDRIGKFYTEEDGKKKYVNQGYEVDEDNAVVAYFEEEEDEYIEIVARSTNWCDDTMDLVYQKKTVKIEKRPINEEDYAQISAIGRGDVFTCVKHIMPKSKKMTLTVDRLERIPFESDGLGMLVTRPKSLEDALGNLKDQTSTMLYKLASEHYSQSNRRLAISQAIQSSGKTVRIGDLKPMTINEMLEFLEKCNVERNSTENMRSAFHDDSAVSEICWNIVMYSESDIMVPDKRKIINNMPKTESRYSTISDLKEVLLSIIDDKLGTSYYAKHTKQQATVESLAEDKEMILKRFSSYFQYYDVKYASSLIMTEFMSLKKNKLWMQPYLRCDDPESFLCDLYGKTLSRNHNYRIRMVYVIGQKATNASKIVNTMYTLEILNSIYPGKFEMEKIMGDEPIKVISSVDPTEINEEDRMKAAVVHYRLTDSTAKLRQVEKEKVYMQHYVIPQQYSNGKYFGPFKVYVKYKGTVLIFEGEPGKMKVTASRTDTHEITKAMMEFTQRNFIMYRYDHPSQWNSSELWNSNDVRKSKLYLNYHCSSATSIGTSSSVHSLPFSLDKGLIYPVSEVISGSYEYVVDKSLRVVSKVIDGETCRVFSIPQDFSCPFIDQVELSPTLIDGFENSELLKNKVIINICTKRYYNTTIGQYQSLLDKRMAPVCPTAMVDFYTKIIGNLDNTHVFPDKETLDMEYETIDILPAMASDMISTMETTSPEDLEYVEVTEVYDMDLSISPKLTATSNLARMMCKIIYGHKTDNDIFDYISIFGSYRDIRESIKRHKDADWGDFSEEMEMWSDVSLSMPDMIDMEVRCFIIGNDLDRAIKYENIEIVNALNTRPKNNINPYIRYISDKTTSNFMYVYLSIDREDIYDEIKF